MSTLIPTKVHLVTFKLTTTDKYNPEVSPIFPGSSRISGIEFNKAVAALEPESNTDWDPVRIYANSIEMMTVLRSHNFKNSISLTNPNTIHPMTIAYLVQNPFNKTEYISFRLVNDSYLSSFNQTVWSPAIYPNLKEELQAYLTATGIEISEMRHTDNPVDAFFDVENHRLITAIELNDPAAHDDYHELLSIFEASTPI